MYFEMNKWKKKFCFFVKGILIEFIVTFVLVTVILMVALDTKSKTGLAPVLIGFALAVNILAV
jgi:glycerol uptake facilitator-like aquaporin